MIDNSFFVNKKRLHFIGVGGSGTFPIVQIMLSQGFEVSGSDNNEGDILARERKLGVKVSLGHQAENVTGADAVIYNAAIKADNAELCAAIEQGIPTIERADILGYISRKHKNNVCVSGTHGKTSATAMLTHILVTSGMDPTAIIGGSLPIIGGYGRSGNSNIMVCEACEFADTFLKLTPSTVILLNIDKDHLDYFGTMDRLKHSFRNFAASAANCLIVNGDDVNTMETVRGLPQKLITFGFSEYNDYYPANIEPVSPIGSRFDLICKGQKLCGIRLTVLGKHNIANAIAACAGAIETGVQADKLGEGLAGFTGAGRRFEIMGKVKGLTVVDDYAHHPAEIEATLKAAMKLGFRKVWAVFQPFTYSRTALLLDDFARTLNIADRVVMSEIMGGREQNTYNIFTKDLADKIPGSAWFPGFDEIAGYVLENAEDGDLVITMGCGDVYKCAKAILQKGSQ